MNRMTAFFVKSSFPKAVVGDDGKRQQQLIQEHSTKKPPD